MKEKPTTSEKVKHQRKIEKLKIERDNLLLEMEKTTDEKEFKTLRNNFDFISNRIDSEQNILTGVWNKYRNKKDNVEIVLDK